MTDTPAVSLRPRTDADLDVLYRLAADLATWEERNPSPPAPLSRSRFDARLAETEAEGSERAASFVIDVAGEAVGSASLFGFDMFAGHAEAGISVLPEVRGRGIGTQAMRLLVEFGFARRNLRRIHLQAIASNAAALRSYAKAGFVVEGRLREHAWVRGRHDDIVLMAILRSDAS